MKLYLPFPFPIRQQWIYRRKRILVYVLYLLQYNCSKYEFRRSSKFGSIVKELSMRGQKKKKSRRPASYSRLTGSSPEATSRSLFSPDSVCWLLRCPRAVVSTILSDGLHFLLSWPPCSFLLLLFSIYSRDNRPQCSSPLTTVGTASDLVGVNLQHFQHRDPQPATVTEHGAASGTSLSNKRV